MGYLDKSVGRINIKGQSGLIHCTCQVCGSGWMVENRFNGTAIVLENRWNICKRCGSTNISNNLREYNNEYVEGG